MRLRGSRANELTGPYRRWFDARNASTSFAAPTILAKVLDSAALAAVDPSVFERDSMLFPAGEEQWPIVTSLAMGVAAARDRVRVLDFGGSLGSLYFQHRLYIETLDVDRWVIVEQPHFVEAGSRLAQDERLVFSADLEAALGEGEFNVAIFSAVLHYLEDYLGPLAMILARQVPVICIDRTFLTAGPEASIWVQHVPKHIYDASYPCHIIRSSDVTRLLSSRGYTLLAAYDSGSFPAVARRGGFFGGFIAVSSDFAPAYGGSS